jgi:hypothetical protein
MNDTNTMRLVLGTPTETLIEEITVLKLTQKDVAITYGLALRDPSNVDWPRVNQAIIERWSEAGLERIKKLAWSGAGGNRD